MSQALCHGTEAKVFSGVHAWSGDDTRASRREREPNRAKTGNWGDADYSGLESGPSIYLEEYQRFLEAQQVICRMSTVDSCADNAAAESFFGRL